MRCRRDTTAYLKDLARLVTNPCHNKCTIIVESLEYLYVLKLYWEYHIDYRNRRPGLGLESGRSDWLPLIYPQFRVGLVLRVCSGNTVFTWSILQRF